MFENFKDDGLRGNPKIKSADAGEFVSAPVLQERLDEMSKILQDPIYFAEKYFYIVNLDAGRQLISIYPKQAEMIRSMCNYQRVVTLASRQCGKSTAYSIFALWYVLSNRDKGMYISSKN